MENESNISLGGTVILHTEALLKAQNEVGEGWGKKLLLVGIILNCTKKA